MPDDRSDGMWISKYFGHDSPIEEKLHRFLVQFFPKDSIEYQKTIGKYRVDFFIKPRFVIEADGKDFHQRGKDDARDSDPCFDGMVTIRCAGSLIHTQPRRVAKRIKEIVDMYSRGTVRGSLKVWHLYHADQIPGCGERS